MTLQRKLLEFFPHGGYFVEAGAHDGVGDSQTLELERAGWKGLCVEPSSYFVGLGRSRKCYVSNACLGPKDGEVVKFREVEGTELSGVINYFGDHWDRAKRKHKDVSLRTITLGTILDNIDAPPVIEFLCLDTEGSELAILSTHNFKRHRFLFMQIEYNGVMTRRIELVDLLCPQGYDVYDDNGTDLMLNHWSWKRES